MRLVHKINSIKFSLIVLIFLLAGCSQIVTETEAQPTATLEISTATPEPTHTPTQAPTPTPTATIEPADGTPEKYLQNLNNLYKKYQKDPEWPNIEPWMADDYLSSDGRYIVLQYGASANYSYPAFDILENQYLEIPIKMNENEYHFVGFNHWSMDGSALLMRASRPYDVLWDKGVLIIQSFDDKAFEELVYTYPTEYEDYTFLLTQDDSRLIVRLSGGYVSNFYVYDLGTNLSRVYSLPEGIYPKDILPFEENDYLVKTFFKAEDGIKYLELRVVDGSAGTSEVVYRTSDIIDFVDYDSERNLLLVKKNRSDFVFIDTLTWTETTFLEADALFGEKTKLIGTCLPYQFEDEDENRLVGLYNLVTGETKLIDVYKYLGWYPLFENHLVVVEVSEDEDRIEFLNVVCE